MAFHGALWTKGEPLGRGQPAIPTSRIGSSCPTPHPWARREDEAASRGSELRGSSLGAVGWGAGCGGLDVHMELAGLLIVKVRVTG